ncbi:MAG: hotdog fold thioesterase [Bacteroidota bacterium]|nr:hotdog fold thioesterase [Bacteroidota bacterium]
MPIWFNKSLTLDIVKDFGKDTMANFLGIEWTELGDDFIEMAMPVNERTQQPYGMLHGGASCVLAETAGSLASALVIDPEKFYCG